MDRNNGPTSKRMLMINGSSSSDGNRDSTLSRVSSEASTPRNPPASPINADLHQNDSFQFEHKPKHMNNNNNNNNNGIDELEVNISEEDIKTLMEFGSCTRQVAIRMLKRFPAVNEAIDHLTLNGEYNSPAGTSSPSSNAANAGDDDVSMNIEELNNKRAMIRPLSRNNTSSSSSFATNRNENDGSQTPSASYATGNSIENIDANKELSQFMKDYKPIFNNNENNADDKDNNFPKITSVESSFTDGSFADDDVYFIDSLCLEHSSNILFEESTVLPNKTFKCMKGVAKFVCLNQGYVELMSINQKNFINDTMDKVISNMLSQNRTNGTIFFREISFSIAFAVIIIRALFKSANFSQLPLLKTIFNKDMVYWKANGQIYGDLVALFTKEQLNKSSESVSVFQDDTLCNFESAHWPDLAITQGQDLIINMMSQKNIQEINPESQMSDFDAFEFPLNEPKLKPDNIMIEVLQLAKVLENWEMMEKINLYIISYYSSPVESWGKTVDVSQISNMMNIIMEISKLRETALGDAGYVSSEPNSIQNTSSSSSSSLASSMVKLESDFTSPNKVLSFWLKKLILPLSYSDVLKFRIVGLTLLTELIKIMKRENNYQNFDAYQIIANKTVILDFILDENRIHVGLVNSSLPVLEFILQHTQVTLIPKILERIWSLSFSQHNSIGQLMNDLLIKLIISLSKASSNVNEKEGSTDRISQVRLYLESIVDHEYNFGGSDSASYSGMFKTANDTGDDTRANKIIDLLSKFPNSLFSSGDFLLLVRSLTWRLLISMLSYTSPNPLSMNSKWRRFERKHISHGIAVLNNTFFVNGIDKQEAINCLVQYAEAIIIALKSNAVKSSDCLRSKYLSPSVEFNEKIQCDIGKIACVDSYILIHFLLHLLEIPQEPRSTNISKYPGQLNQISSVHIEVIRVLAQKHDVISFFFDEFEYEHDRVLAKGRNNQDSISKGEQISSMSKRMKEEEDEPFESQNIVQLNGNDTAQEIDIFTRLEKRLSLILYIIKWRSKDQQDPQHLELSRVKNIWTLLDETKSNDFSHLRNVLRLDFMTQLISTNQTILGGNHGLSDDSTNMFLLDLSTMFVDLVSKALMRIFDQYNSKSEEGLPKKLRNENAAAFDCLESYWNSFKQQDSSKIWQILLDCIWSVLLGPSMPQMLQIRAFNLLQQRLDIYKEQTQRSNCIQRVFNRIRSVMDKLSMSSQQSENISESDLSVLKSCIHFLLKLVDHSPEQLCYYPHKYSGRGAAIELAVDISDIEVLVKGNHKDLDFGIPILVQMHSHQPVYDAVISVLREKNLDLGIMYDDDNDDAICSKAIQLFHLFNGTVNMQLGKVILKDPINFDDFASAIRSLDSLHLINGSTLVIRRRFFPKIELSSMKTSLPSIPIVAFEKSFEGERIELDRDGNSSKHIAIEISEFNELMEILLQIGDKSLSTDLMANLYNLLDSLPTSSHFLKRFLNMSELQSTWQEIFSFHPNAPALSTRTKYYLRAIWSILCPNVSNYSSKIAEKIRKCTTDFIKSGGFIHLIQSLCKITDRSEEYDIESLFLLVRQIDFFSQHLGDIRNDENVILQLPIQDYIDSVSKLIEDWKQMMSDDNEKKEMHSISSDIHDDNVLIYCMRSVMQLIKTLDGKGLAKVSDSLWKNCIYLIQNHSQVSVRSVYTQMIKQMWNSGYKNTIMGSVIKSMNQIPIKGGNGAKEYFDLLQLSLKESLSNKNSSSQIENIGKEMLEVMFDISKRLLKKNETRTNGDDIVLSMLISLLCDLIRSEYSNCDRNQLFGFDISFIFTWIFNDLLFSSITIENKNNYRACIGNEAIDAALDLLLLVITHFNHQDNGADNYYEEEAASHISKLFEKAQESFSMNAYLGPKNSFVGLVNQGATCYMNSLLQQLYMAPAFKKIILDEKVETMTPANLTEKGLQSINDANKIFNEVKRTFSYLEWGSSRCFDALRLVDECKSLNLMNSVYQQNDARDFCDKLVDRIELAMKNANKGDLLMTDCFGGQIAHQNIKFDCPHKNSDKINDFICLELQIKGKSSILDSLQDLVSGEILDGENKVLCEECNKKYPAKLRDCILKLPNLLILHLKRFDLDYDTFETIKINDKCAFPLELDMAPYTQDFLSDKIKKGDPESQYRLCGVLVHSGVAGGGHYYSFIKKRCDGNDEWYKFNDETITPFNPDFIPYECYGQTPLRGDSIISKDEKSHFFSPGSPHAQFTPPRKTTIGETTRSSSNQSNGNLNLPYQDTEVANPSANAYMLFYEKIQPIHSQKEDIKMEQDIENEYEKEVVHSNACSDARYLFMAPRMWKFLIGFHNYLWLKSNLKLESHIGETLCSAYADMVIPSYHVSVDAKYINSVYDPLVTIMKRNNDIRIYFLGLYVPMYSPSKPIARDAKARIKDALLLCSIESVRKSFIGLIGEVFSDIMLQSSHIRDGLSLLPQFLVFLFDFLVDTVHHLSTMQQLLELIHLCIQKFSDSANTSVLFEYPLIIPQRIIHFLLAEQTPYKKNLDILASVASSIVEKDLDAADLTFDNLPSSTVNDCLPPPYPPWSLSAFVHLDNAQYRYITYRPLYDSLAILLESPSDLPQDLQNYLNDPGSPLYNLLILDGENPYQFRNWLEFIVRNHSLSSSSSSSSSDVPGLVMEGDDSNTPLPKALESGEKIVCDILSVITSTLAYKILNLHEERYQSYASTLMTILNIQDQNQESRLRRCLSRESLLNEIYPQYSYATSPSNAEGIVEAIQTLADSLNAVYNDSARTALKRLIPLLLRIVSEIPATKSLFETALNRSDTSDSSILPSHFTLTMQSISQSLKKCLDAIDDDNDLKSEITTLMALAGLNNGAME